MGDVKMGEVGEDREEEGGGCTAQFELVGFFSIGLDAES